MGNQGGGEIIRHTKVKQRNHEIPEYLIKAVTT